MAQDVHFEIKKRSPVRYAITAVATLALIVGAFYIARFETSGEVVFGKTLKVHYSPSYAGEERIIKFINDHVAPDYGIALEAVPLTDGTQADRAVAEGALAASIYQHQWWLKQVIEANGFELTPTQTVFQWGFGLYSDKYESIAAVPNGALVALPSDGANQGQALWLLERAGLLGLDKNIEARTAKLKDIAENPHNFQFKEFELETLPRVLESVDVSIGYISNFDAGKVPRSKGILFPKAPATFACQLVIGTKFLNDPNIIKLRQAFADKRVENYLRTTDDPLVAGVLTAVSED
ncbi:metal ABC transporter substrate-binding protein [Campylobacterota bacterium]|nr:metal ABC transporter substrate-binding protein [Campylobacterota bacterium]